MIFYSFSLNSVGIGSNNHLNGRRISTSGNVQPTVSLFQQRKCFSFQDIFFKKWSRRSHLKIDFLSLSLSVSLSLPPSLPPSLSLSLSLSLSQTAPNLRSLLSVPDLVAPYAHVNCVLLIGFLLRLKFLMRKR